MQQTIIQDEKNEPNNTEKLKLNISKPVSNMINEMKKSTRRNCNIMRYHRRSIEQRIVPLKSKFYYKLDSNIH